MGKNSMPTGSTLETCTFQRRVQENQASQEYEYGFMMDDGETLYDMQGEKVTADIYDWERSAVEPPRNRSFVISPDGQSMKIEYKSSRILPMSLFEGIGVISTEDLDAATSPAEGWAADTKARRGDYLSVEASHEGPGGSKILWARELLDKEIARGKFKEEAESSANADLTVANMIKWGAFLHGLSAEKAYELCALLITQPLSVPDVVQSVVKSLYKDSASGGARHGEDPMTGDRW